MSKELELKSATKKADKRLVGVKTTHDCIFWGINSSQLSETMACLHLEWTGDYVRVTHDSFPGQEKWLLPGGIREMTWKSE